MRRVCLAWCAAVVIAFASPAAAAVITFQATDLADDVGGGDRWLYEYLVTDVNFALDQGFSLFFDLALFENLASPPPPVGADWDILTFQPDAGLSSDGVYDALALADDASLLLPFTVTFDWLGGAGTRPGSQAFTINQFDALGNVTTLESGRTTTAAGVPEPATFALIGLGASLLVRRVRRIA